MVELKTVIQWWAPQHLQDVVAALGDSQGPGARAARECQLLVPLLLLLPSLLLQLLRGAELGFLLCVDATRAHQLTCMLLAVPAVPALAEMVLEARTAGRPLGANGTAGVGAQQRRSASLSPPAAAAAAGTAGQPELAHAAFAAPGAASQVGGGGSSGDGSEEGEDGQGEEGEEEDVEDPSGSESGSGSEDEPEEGEGKSRSSHEQRTGRARGAAGAEHECTHCGDVVAKIFKHPVTSARICMNCNQYYRRQGRDRPPDVILKLQQDRAAGKVRGRRGSVGAIGPDAAADGRGTGRGRGLSAGGRGRGKQPGHGFRGRAEGKDTEPSSVQPGGAGASTAAQARAAIAAAAAWTDDSSEDAAAQGGSDSDYRPERVEAQLRRPAGNEGSSADERGGERAGRAAARRAASRDAPPPPPAIQGVDFTYTDEHGIGTRRPPCLRCSAVCRMRGLALQRRPRCGNTRSGHPARSSCPAACLPVPPRRCRADQGRERCGGGQHGLHV